MYSQKILSLSLLIVAISFVGCPPSGPTVPNVHNMTEAAAINAIVDADYVVGDITEQSSATIAAGHVISQNPAAGASAAAGTSVDLVVSTGPTNPTVPNVVDMTQAAATDAIQDAGFTVGDITTQGSLTVAAGDVISQNPTAGTHVAAGTAVDLVISTGAQPEVGWSYDPSDSVVWGLTIDHTDDGGYIIGGGHSAYNMYALKLGSTGAFGWEKTYSNITPDSNHTELWRHEARGLHQTSDGGYIMLGSGHNLGDGLPGSSFLLVKTLANGDVDWSQAYEPDNPYSLGHLCSGTEPAALQVTSDGGYMAAGSSYVGLYDLASIVKTDADGNVEFCKVINDNARAWDEQIMAAQQTLDGGYALAGYSENSNPARGYMALLIKVDSAGDLEWSKQYQFPSEDHGAEAYSLKQTADGGYLIGGDLVNDIPKSLGHGCWIAKVDSNGDEVWSISYDNTTIARPYDIEETPQGDFLATGNKDGQMILSKFNSDGDLLWNFMMEEYDSTGNALTLTDDGGCVIVGSGGSTGTVVVKVNNVFIPE